MDTAALDQEITQGLETNRTIECALIMSNKRTDTAVPQSRVNNTDVGQPTNIGRTVGKMSAYPPGTQIVRAGTHPAAAPSGGACRGCPGSRRTTPPAWTPVPAHVRFTL